MNVIQRIEIDWMSDWDNAPQIRALFDSINYDLSYEKRHCTYLAINNDYVSFFSWCGPDNAGGYSGRAFHIKMKDGSDETLLGPWSSSSQAVNSIFPETPVIEANITDNEEVMQRGYTFGAGAITLESLFRLKGPFKISPSKSSQKVHPITEVAYLCKLHDGHYTFAINESGVFETKWEWRARLFNKKVPPYRSRIAEIYGL